MRFILQYPEATGSELDLLDVGSIPDLARAAEAAGWDGIALTEHPAASASWLESGGHQSLDRSSPWRPRPR
jgi:alkanesulfonate monooxygenase SsuD/methylene tetrahydromethanopterin reductase-like flavin-dependent oxidoreductase (luciferase family)